MNSTVAKRLLLIFAALSTAQAFVLPSRGKDANSSTSCPQGWTQGVTFSNKCYAPLGAKNETTYLQAQRRCRAADSRANLATIINAFENSEVVAIAAVNQDFSLDYYFGLNDLAGAKNWTWLSGINSTWTHWDWLEPFYHNGNGCMHINLYTGNWQTHPCNDAVEYNSLCEIYLS